MSGFPKRIYYCFKILTFGEYINLQKYRQCCWRCGANLSETKDIIQSCGVESSGTEVLYTAHIQTLKYGNGQKGDRLRTPHSENIPVTVCAMDLYLMGFSDGRGRAWRALIYIIFNCVTHTCSHTRCDTHSTHFHLAVRVHIDQMPPTCRSGLLMIVCCFQ